MKRRILLVVLGLGTLAGFGSAFCEARARHGARRETFERHVAEVCLEAARAK
jgi:hypothetical protein